MNNSYVNSFILFLLVVSLVVINFNQEEETFEVEQDEEIQVIDTSTTSTTTSSTTSTSTTTTVYTGPFAEYTGFEGTNQTTLDELVKQLPPLLLQIIETNNISTVSYTHLTLPTSG